MLEGGHESKLEWNRYWLATYHSLGGESPETGAKGCPKAASFGLWYLGFLGNRPRLDWTIARIDQELGKNAAYAAIAIKLLLAGASQDIAVLWPAVRDFYHEITGEEAAGSEQGEVRLVVALFKEKQL
jgi:hypothetical protein